MSPDDREAYRRWWEERGRGNLLLCPCGAPADTLALTNGRPVLAAGHDLCPRHRFDLSGGDRETFAQCVIDGTFEEADLGHDEYLAELFAERFLRGGPN